MMITLVIPLSDHNYSSYICLKVQTKYESITKYGSI